MALIDSLFDAFEMFFVTIVCVLPGGFATGMVIAISLVFLLNLFTPILREGKSSKGRTGERYAMLCAAFIGAFLTFPISRFINRYFNESELVLRDYLAIVFALFCFALLTPMIAGESLSGADGEETNRNVYTFWIALALGGLAGAVGVLIWLS